MAECRVGVGEAWGRVWREEVWRAGVNERAVAHRVIDCRGGCQCGAPWHAGEMAAERGREGGVEISAKSPSSCTRSWQSAVRVQRRDGGEFGGRRCGARG